VQIIGEQRGSATKLTQFGRNSLEEIVGLRELLDG
jgi:hypothetical protein